MTKMMLRPPRDLPLMKPWEKTLVPKVDIQAHAPTVWAFGRMSEDAVVVIHTGPAGICSVGN